MSTESSGEQFGELFKLLDKDKAISERKVKWVVYWDESKFLLVSSNHPKRATESADIRLVELAHSDEAVLLQPRDFKDLERELDVLAKNNYLKKEGRGIYAITDKLFELMDG